MAGGVHRHRNLRQPADKTAVQHRSRAGVVGGDAEREKLVTAAASGVEWLRVVGGAAFSGGVLAVVVGCVRLGCCLR